MVANICTCEHGHRSGTGLAPSRRQAITRTVGNKPNWNWNKNTTIFMQDSSFEYIVYKMPATLVHVHICHYFGSVVFFQSGSIWYPGCRKCREISRHSIRERIDFSPMSLYSPSGRYSCARGVSFTSEKRRIFPPVTWANNPLQLRSSQPTFKLSSHVLYPTDSPNANRPGLCNSLDNVFSKPSLQWHHNERDGVSNPRTNGQ